MVDAHALGACGLGRAGSNPASPTKGWTDEIKTYVICSTPRHSDCCAAQAIGLCWD